jgi:hypothetical protein
MSRPITQQVSRVARETVNCRGYYHVAGGELLHQRGKLRPVGRRAGDLLAEHLSHPAALSWRTCPVSSWTAVETRA